MIDGNRIVNYIKALINPYGKPFDGTVYDFGLKLIDHIEYMEKQGEWISCDEKLPEDEGMYLITSKRLNGIETQYVFYQKNIELFICNGIAIAWMPLPEPYKGE